MVDNNIFGERVKDYRISANMTQKDLGEAIGLSKQAINDIEQGRRQTTINKAILMARLFNTTVEYLSGDTDDSTRPVKLPYIEYLFSNEETFLFAKRIKMLRESLNLSYQDVGKATYLGTLRYKNLEYGDKSPDFSILIILANYFDVSIDYLVGRTDNKHSHKL